MNNILFYLQVRRLRIQQRIKSAELGILKEERENELPNFPSFIPFLPPLVSFVELVLNHLKYAFNSRTLVILSQFLMSMNNLLFISRVWQMVINNILFAEFCKSQAILCDLFFSYRGDYYFWGSPCAHCKIFLHLVLCFQACIK